MTRFEPGRVRVLREAVYLDAINPIRLGVEQYSHTTDDWTGLDLTTAASFSVELEPALNNTNAAQGPFTTIANPGIVTAPEAGSLVLTLGELAIDPGDYYVQVDAIDVADDITTVISPANPHYRLMVTVAA